MNKDPDFHGSMSFTMLENTQGRKITNLCLSKENDYLFSASSNMIRQWNAETGTIARIFESRSNVGHIAVSKNYIYSSGIEQNSTIDRWEIEIGLHHTVRTGQFTKVAADNHGFLYTTVDGLVLQIDAKTGTVTRRIGDLGMTVTKLQVSEYEGATYIVALGIFYKIGVWRLAHQILIEIDSLENFTASLFTLRNNTLTWYRNKKIYQVDLTRPELYKVASGDMEISSMSASDRYVFVTDGEILSIVDMVS